MRLTILGSGTYQPELDRHSAGYLIEVGNQKLCFDFGRGAIDQLLKKNIQITEIDAIFISHWHGDHIADLIPLLHYTTAPVSDKVSIVKLRVKPLRIFGPKGTKENIEHLLKAIYRNNDKGNLEIQEIESDRIEGEGWAINSFIGVHDPNIIALCYRVEADGKVLAYSGDGSDSEGLRAALQDADVAIIEASWPNQIKPTTHFSGQMVGQLAQGTGVKKMIATHIAPYYLKNFDPVKDTKEKFTGEILLAKDGMEVEI